MSATLLNEYGMVWKDANVMFFSGLMLAIAVEKWNLHKRIALQVLMLMGSKSLWSVLRLMFS